MTHNTQITLDKVHFNVAYKCSTFAKATSTSKEVILTDRMTYCYCIVSRLVNITDMTDDVVKKSLKQFGALFSNYAKRTWGSKFKSCSKPLAERVDPNYAIFKLVLFFNAKKLDEIVSIPKF